MLCIDRSECVRIIVLMCDCHYFRVRSRKRTHWKFPTATFWVCPEHRIYSAFNHSSQVTFQKCSSTLIPSRQLMSLSSVTNPGLYWYFCATPDCTSDNRKNGKYSYTQIVLFHADSYTRKQALTPPPHTHTSFLKVCFINCGTCRQNKSMSSSILMVFVLLF